MNHSLTASPSSWTTEKDHSILYACVVYPNTCEDEVATGNSRWIPSEQAVPRTSQERIAAEHDDSAKEGFKFKCGIFRQPALYVVYLGFYLQSALSLLWIIYPAKSYAADQGGFPLQDFCDLFDT